MATNIKQQILVVILIVLTGLLSILLVEKVFPFTYEGELDPNDFDKWEIISSQLSPEGLVFVFVKNPDLKSPIEIVALIMRLDGTLLGYQYFKNARAYIYVFDAEKDKYIQRILTEEQQKGCMECHPDKVGKECS